MRASIIITSFNRPELLSFGLESLDRQKLPKDEIEIIVLNDGDPYDGTEGVCELFEDDLNIKYYSASNRKDWRIPGYAINFGVKNSNSENIFISCAEIYHMEDTVHEMLKVLDENSNVLVIPKQGKDDDGSFLDKLKKGKVIEQKDYGKLELLHNIHLPFFMGMKKSNFVKIGGYDEDFIGCGWDDNDIVDRLVLSGNKHVKTNSRIVHLYHPRLQFKDPIIKSKFTFNNSIYRARKRIILRNKGENWGNSF